MLNRPEVQAPGEASNSGGTGGGTPTQSEVPLVQENSHVLDDAGVAEEAFEALVGENRDLPVFVAGDREAHYEVVLEAMALLQQAGVDKVGLMSQPVGTATK